MSVAATATAAPEASEIYQYFTTHLSALLSSLPLLFIRLISDISTFLLSKLSALSHFFFPNWQWSQIDTSSTSELLTHLVQNADTAMASILDKFNSTSSTLFEDTEELKKAFVDTLLQNYHQAQKSLQHSSWGHWIQTKLGHVITADRTLASYLWSTCRGLILFLTITSIIPGRLHGWTGRALRFPVLGMVYLLIFVELILYIIIRFMIRTLEWIFANPKHRQWRNDMSRASSYKEWYNIAKLLDESQGRSIWTTIVNDDTAYRYSWPFILELLHDLKSSRKKGDVVMAMAVLQQCTRKNVGGIMSEDMFSYTNAGEPKVVVEEFVKEVARTLRWVTQVVVESGGGGDGCVVDEEGGGSVDDDGQHQKQQKLMNNTPNNTVAQTEAEVVEQELKAKRVLEENKLYASLMEWATLNILNAQNTNGNGKTQSNSKEDASSAPTTPMRTTQPSSNNSNNHIPADHKNIILRTKIKTFLKRARAAYGRTALCLSGGAMMGNYHFGAVKALLETGLLPHIISGTSAGSVIGAMLCTRTDEELLSELKPEVLYSKMVSLCYDCRWLRCVLYGFTLASNFTLPTCI
jgi:hypothetical protein